MSVADKVLWQIEMSLETAITLEDLAARCAVSPFHMSRTFRLATGMSPMTYLRARRLSRAAVRLAEGEADILGIALDTQYASHEAFSRAFATYFGLSPSAVREAGTTQSLTMMEPITMNKDMLVDVALPELRERDAMRVIGMSARCSPETIAKIPSLWQTFNARVAEVAKPGNETAFGVCTDGDGAGNFRYVAGVEVAASAKLPEGMDDVTVPAGKHAVFTHSGHISDFPKTVYTIWNKGLTDAGLTHRPAPDFELYDQRFNPETGRGEVEIWIPVV
ncbi:MAG: AraC family transcriptional regulator [Pseudomonadota bacterium]